MKAALFSIVPYRGEAERDTWPVPARTYSADVARRSMEMALEQYELADELGFDWVTLAEHHFAPLSLTPNPMVLAGAVTQRVRRAKIALLGATIPILNPVRVAEEFAMLDTLTGGRVVAGMLRGTANEYVTYDVNPAESWGRFEEAMELIIRAWTEPQPFGWQGRHFRFRSVSIWPRPVQQPHPPIYMSASSPESGEFAARHRVRIGFAFTTLPLASAAARHYRECAAACGWEPGPDDVLYRVTAHLADTDEQALEELRASGADAPRLGFSASNRPLDDAAASAGYYGRDATVQRGRIRAQGRPMAERIEQGQLLAGSPDTVLAQARRIRDELGAGILEVVFSPMAREKTLRAIELFGTRVLPRLRAL
ncbi:MAG TPA: LLM class flavin-dependent oxidoreductase [Candidatus Dormibacteraeota bacterium]|nr:LLM class flavin-dependent oxidoreductase [Candidatus Dormibacteraeota bacterium]